MSEAVLISGRFAEIDVSSISLWRAKADCLSQNIASIDFRCLKEYDFLATVLVRGGGGNEKRG